MPKRKRTRKTGKTGAAGGTKGARSPVRRRRRASRPGSRGGVLELASQARTMARRALERLRQEIRDAEKRLEDLVASERSFRMDLFGGSAGAQKRGKSRRGARRKGPAKADRFYEQLPQSFTLEQVRKVAGGLTGVSLAQWGRSKKVKKVGKGKYRKVA